MFRPIYWMMGVLGLLFALNVYAASCASDADCDKWALNTCACGVSARCNGITAQNKMGNCQCFGAEGHCDRNDTTEDVYVAPGVDDRREEAARIRRNGVRRNNVDVDVSR